MCEKRVEQKIFLNEIFIFGLNRNRGNSLRFLSSSNFSILRFLYCSVKLLNFIISQELEKYFKNFYLDLVIESTDRTIRLSNNGPRNRRDI